MFRKRLSRRRLSALTLSDDVFGCVRRCHWTHNKYVKDSLAPTGWSFVSCAAMMMRQVSIRFVFEIEFLREHLFYRIRSMFILRITVLGYFVSLQPSTPIHPTLLKALRIFRGMIHSETNRLCGTCRDTGTSSIWRVVKLPVATTVPGRYAYCVVVCGRKSSFSRFKNSIVLTNKTY